MRFRFLNLLLAGTCLLVAALVFGAFPRQNASAQTNSKTFTPTADAYVIQSTPDANFGTSTVMRVDQSPITRSYLRFTISGLNGDTIQSAKLRIYANSSNTTGYSVNSVSSSAWSESTISYNNAPAPGSLIATSPAIASGQWTEVDVTSTVKGEGTYNLALTTSSSTNTSLASREDTAHAPQLVVTYSAAPTFTFAPTADAYVIRSDRGANFGAAPVLRVDNSPFTYSYLRFYVNGLSGGVAQSAKLRIYANSSNTTGFSVYAETNDTWTENGITYNNAPPKGILLTTSPAVVAGQWTEVDITKYIVGDGTYELVLGTSSSTNTSLASREDTAHAPQLIVTTGGALPPTASPVETSTGTPTPVLTSIATQPAATSPANTATLAATPAFTATPMTTPVFTATLTLTTPVLTATHTPTPLSTATLTPTPANTATRTPTPLSTATQLPTPTQTPVQLTATPVSGLTKVSLTKGPDLVYTGTNTAMKIFWQWTANTSFRVDWGTTASYGQSSPVISAADTTNHLYSYTITGLTPGTKYYYRVVVGSQYSDGSFFAAPPAAATTLKFFSYGDTRSNPSTDDAVAAQVVALFQSDPAYQTINLDEGDIVSSGDTDSTWTSEFFSPSFTHIRAMLANIVVAPVIGNHEGSGSLFQRYFPEPFVAARYYSYDYGPVHFIFLDQYTTYSAGSAQFNWFKNDLASTTKKWKVVMFHEPGWSANGGHTNNTTMQTVYEPLFEQYNVALILAGHNHYYARAMVNGIPELTVGTGGAPLYTPASGQPNIVKTYSGNGYTRFTISGSTLTGEFINSSGTLIDTFSVTR